MYEISGRSADSFPPQVHKLLTAELTIPTEHQPFRFPFSISTMRRLIFALLIVVAALAPSPGHSQALEGNVTINPNDVLNIKVFREDELESTLRVSRDGLVIFPLIGTVKVAGKSPEQAADLIRSLLAKDYLVNPQVAVTITVYDKRRFSVLGEVQKPGSYDMPDREGLTLLEALAMAGGYTRIADPSKITLKRQQGDKKSVLQLNAKNMARDNKISTFEIQAGDVITVGESLF
jgi:polysaccharide export outer membrane protein